METQRIIALTALLLAVQLLTGCAVAHRYPAYQGQVLELGTDKPIEGAGVLAKYNTQSTCIAGRTWKHLAWQAVLTAADGRFEIPAKTFVALRPLSWFDDEVRITIFKYGYGSYPGSFSNDKPSFQQSRYAVSQYGEIAPLPARLHRLEPNKDYILWLPKLETQEEMDRHYMLFDKMLSIGGLFIPPRGTALEQFGYGDPDKTWRKGHEEDKQ